MSDQPGPGTQAAGPSAGSVLPDLGAALGEVERTAGKAADAAKSPAQLDAEDRSWIARRVVEVFYKTILGVLALLAVAGLRDPSVWSTVATTAADVIKSAVIPVVTLVLGYYFGRGGKG